MATVANKITPADLETRRAIASSANEAMGSLGEVERQLDILRNSVDAARQKVLDDARDEFDALTKKRDELIDRLVELIGTNFSHLARPGIKTVFLANGTFADKTSPLQLIVDGSEADAIADIRKLGLVRKFLRTKTVYSLDKIALKKALTEANPRVISKLKKVRGLATQQKRNWVITPNRTQVDIDIVRNPLVVPLSAGD